MQLCRLHVPNRQVRIVGLNLSFSCQGRANFGAPRAVELDCTATPLRRPAKLRSIAGQSLLKYWSINGQSPPKWVHRLKRVPRAPIFPREVAVNRWSIAGQMLVNQWSIASKMGKSPQEGAPQTYILPCMRFQDWTPSCPFIILKM